MGGGDGGGDDDDDDQMPDLIPVEDEECVFSDFSIWSCNIT